MLAFRNGRTNHQSTVLEKTVLYAGLPHDKKYRVWSEVKMKIATENEEAEAKSFDYTFDYLITGVCRKTLADVAAMIDKTEKKTRSLAEKNGFTLAKRGGLFWIEDLPSDPVVIVEIMTSSTSGGDKKKRTQIAMAFEDAVTKGSDHNGPTINYRQVWARMVSQLIVKSQVGIAWGGKTIWLLQDVLADYISSSTALNLERYLSAHADEVNILAFGYGAKANTINSDEKIIELRDSKFYAGPISKAKEPSGGFVDIVKIGAPPPKEKLWKSLFLKASSGFLRT